ncbi:MAG: hypothetical protein K6F93_04975, partial [Lachnospiraceae bacterium]|nr:hypothetical protein [Lachnospiraceae bacterium]
MKIRTAKGICYKCFKTFRVMLLILALIIPYMNGIRIQVQAAESPEITKIYAHTAENQDPTDIELVSGSESVAGKDLIGKFIHGGSYSLTDEDSDILIIADNASVTTGDIDVALWNFKLSGASELIYPNYTLSSTESRFSSYPASAGAITVERLQAHYDAEGTPYYSDPSKEIWSRSYDLTVTGDMHIAGTQGTDDNGNPRVDPFWIGYNDINVNQNGKIYVEEGGHLLVEHSLNVESGGTLTGSGDDHYLRVCSGAAITGLPLYAETPNNDVSSAFYSSSPAEYEFRYDSDAKEWIYPFDLYAPIYNFSIGGLDLSTENISVHYKHSGNGNYIEAHPSVTYDDGLTASFGISLKNMLDDTQPFSLKIEFFPSENSTKTMLCWRDSRDPVDPIYDGIRGNVFEFSLTLDKYVEISLGYLNSGKPEIKETVNDYLYAYSGEEDAIKSYLATELYNRFIKVAMFEDFGIPDADELKNRITKTDVTDTINATAKDGTSVPVTVTNYKVEWGNDMKNGDPVVSNIPVYTLPDKDSFLICTDFNKDNGTGNTFYIRKAHEDEVPFDGDQDYAISVIVPSINPETIVAGGMGSDTAVHNSDHVYSFSFNSRWLNSIINGPSSDTDPANYGTLIRIMSETETYIWLKGEGETKQYGNIGSSFYG